MTVNGSAQYATATAFRRAVEDRLKREAKARGRPLEELRREFLFQRFLALVFSAPDRPWVLKGGASLLMRLAGARFSRDLDLFHLGEVGPEQAIAELRELTASREGDHLTFVVEDAVTYSTANPVVEIKVTSYIGAKYGSFPIDLSTDLHIVAKPDLVRPNPVVEVPGMQELPEVVVYPLPDQVADKVCAMYERHGDTGNQSSRFRDLVDLALIVSRCELDGRLTSVAVASEKRRRRMDLPVAMISPGPQWPAGYASNVRKSRLAAELQHMDAALVLVAGCLDPILAGERTSGIWVPKFGWLNDADRDSRT